MNATDIRCRVAVFASGNGSNAENIVKRLRDASCGTGVALIVTNRADAGVVSRAARLGVPVEILSRDDIADSRLLMAVMERYAIDFVVLAGFLLMIPPCLVDRYRGRIINLHPSLLPRHGGKGMYGHRVHEAVIAAGDTTTGITIHHVSERYDEGRVIRRVSMAVGPADTPASVEARIHELEYEHYPQVIIEMTSALISGSI